MTPELVTAVLRARRNKVISTAPIGSIYQTSSGLICEKIGDCSDPHWVKVKYTDEDGNVNKGVALCKDLRLLQPPQPPKPSPDRLGTSSSDGSTADYYELPKGATQLQDLISHANMNAQIGEIFRAAYRFGRASHSNKLRDAKKIKFYIEAEIKRLEQFP
jgi:hypothetical protein